MREALARGSFHQQNPFKDYHYQAEVFDCRESAPRSATTLAKEPKYAKITLSYTTMKDDPKVIMIGTYAKLLISIYKGMKVIDSGDVIQTVFKDDLNKTLNNEDKGFLSFHKYGQMGWGDILIFDRINLSYTWKFPGNKLNFSDLNGGFQIRSSSGGLYCLDIRNIRFVDYGNKYLHFTIFYILLVCVQIAGIIASIGLIQFNGSPYIKTIPRLSLINSWMVDLQLMILSLVYLPCFIYAFIGQMFIVLFSIISANPHIFLEGEQQEMRLKKKISLAAFAFVAAGLHLYLMFFQPNFMPYYSLSMYFFMVVDNFLNFNKQFKYVYFVGIYLPKSLLISYIFHYKDNVHMGPVDSLSMWVDLGTVGGCLFLMIFQCALHPRFFLKSRYERELLKLVPKSMLLEDLLKQSKVTEDECCGICLEPFGVDQTDKANVEAIERINQLQTGITGLTDSIIDQSSTSEASSSVSPDSTQLQLTDPSISISMDPELNDSEMESSLPPKKLKSFKKKNSKSNATLCITQCGHIFHRRCLVIWLKKNSNCPICRQTCLDRV